MRRELAPDHEIARLATTQQGVVGRRQLAALGLSSQSIGYAYHRSPTAFESDREREVLLAVAGWRVLRFTWRQITRRAAWVARVVDT